MPKTVTAYQVLQKMHELDSKAMFLAPLAQITQLQSSKKGCLVTIGIPGEHMGPLARHEFIGGLLLIRREEYDRIKKEMESGD